MDTLEDVIHSSERGFVVDGYELLPSEFSEYNDLRERGLNNAQALHKISRYFFRRDRVV
jgi:hypothetical protein